MGWILSGRKNASRQDVALQQTTRSADSSGNINDELAAQVRRLEAREDVMARTVWAREMAAQQFGRVIELFWDSINASSNKLGVAAELSIPEIIVPRWRTTENLPHDIKVFANEGTGVAWSSGHWRDQMNALTLAGWKLEQAELRHTRCEVDEAGEVSASHVEIAAALFNVNVAERMLMEGSLVIEWNRARGEIGLTSIQRVDASRLTLKSRKGVVPFEIVLSEPIPFRENSFSIDPLLVQDLDGDGFSEVILAGKNRAYRRDRDGRYQPGVLCAQDPGLISTALLADMDGDGKLDFLCMKHEGLMLFTGSAVGTFEKPGIMVWSAPEDLKYPMVMTAGDVDADGDLDLFLGQYKVPYQLGSMPTPFYDANDGHPAYLLGNDGHGQLTDATAGSGLLGKRWRRTYSCSLADLDADGKLDLVVVSDFAGLDIYKGDGRGSFTDVTRLWVRETQAFGMAHALSDFNRDGRIDLLMMGMTSATASRLDAFGLWRSAGEDRTMRRQMTQGNRLYLSQVDGSFAHTSLSDTIARSGWSWGCGVADFDNDGFPDVYVANGLESRETVRDYESEFWLHDQFVANSKEQPASYLYFKYKFGRTRGTGHSYGGYERTRLFLNREARTFLDVGYLFGVSMQEDSRNAVADDLDGDGRPDLVVTSFEAWPETRQTLRMFRNRLPGTGNWIGFRFRDRVDGRSPLGSSILITTPEGVAIRQVISGDSYRSQGPASVHFGLGGQSKVERMEVRWSNGQSDISQNPEINRYHWIQ